MCVPGGPGPGGALAQCDRGPHCLLEQFTNLRESIK